MTFPVVSSVNYSEETADTTTHDVAIPASISAGDLLILWVNINDKIDPEPTMTGWTKIIYLNGTGTTTMGVWYKFASGSETAFTYATPNAQRSASRTWRVTGAHASSAPEMHISLGSNGFTATPFGEATTPTWGAADTLWTSFVVFNSSPTVSAYPTNYTDNQFTDATGTGSVQAAGLAMASRNLNTATESSSTWTLSSAVSTIARTLAIRPVAAVGGASVLDPMGMSGFFGA